MGIVVTLSWKIDHGYCNDKMSWFLGNTHKKMCLWIFSSENGYILIQYRNKDVHFLEETRHCFVGDQYCLKSRRNM